MKIIRNIKENYSAEVMLLTIASFLAGVVAAIIILPVKNGIAIGSYNGCYSGWFNGSGKKVLDLMGVDDESDNTKQG